MRNLVCIIGAIGVAACSSSEENEASNVSPDAEISATSSPAIGPEIPVNSDPGVTYYLVDSSKLSNGNLEVTTERNGSSGRSYARREINCGNMTFRYLGEGDTLDEAKIDGPNLGAMSEAMSTSISGEVSRYACANS